MGKFYLVAFREGLDAKTVKSTSFLQVFGFTCGSFKIDAPRVVSPKMEERYLLKERMCRNWESSL